MQKPKMIQNPDIRELKEMCQDWLDNYDPDYDDDTPHHIYEEAMCALFGRDVFSNYLNKIS